MRFENFQDSHLGAIYLRYWTRTILAILNLYVDPMPPIKFQLNPHYCFGGESFEDFQDGQHSGHLRYWNGMILAILNLHVAQMPPSKADSIRSGTNLGCQNDTNLVVLSQNDTNLVVLSLHVNPSH